MIISKHNNLNLQDLNEYAVHLDQAYLNRAKYDSRIRYKPISITLLRTQLDHHNTVVLIARNGQTIVGGTYVRIATENNVVIGNIFHLFTHPDFQGRGIAKQLMLKAEEHSIKAGCSLLQLNVGHIVKPAISLYKKLGYRPLHIYACEPKTFHFIRMIKPLAPYHYPESKRILTLFFSKLKFYSLFHSDSTPHRHQKVFLKLFHKL